MTIPLHESAPPDITEGFPVALPEGLLAAYGASSDWDVSIGALGFNLRVSERNPYIRATEPVRKQQFDASQSPGEQSLSSWWTRSQDSWDHGAGIRWYDPGVSEETRDRFGDSDGVDVWTPGEFSLLPRLVEADVAVPVGHLSTTTVGGVPAVAFADGPLVGHYTSAGGHDTATLGGGGASQPAVHGERVFVGRDGGVDVYDPNTGVVSEVATVTGAARVWYTKARLLVAVGNKMWWVSPNSVTDVDADGVLLYEHPDAAWVWTDVAEAGGAVLASGRSAGNSAVFRFTVTEEDGVPALGYGEQVAALPPGEAITCMGVYLGASLVLGTTLGVRVGEVADSGEVRYGPLTALTGSPVTDVAFRDRFAFLGAYRASEGAVYVLRVDLSAQADEMGRFAWAWDVRSGEVASGAGSVAFLGEQAVLAAGGSLWVPDGQKVPSGWLSTGRIRFGTNEPKAFRLVRVTGAPNGGRIEMRAQVDGTEFLLTSFSDESPPGAEAPVLIPGRSLLQFLELRVVLRSDGAADPTVSGWTLKASPSPSRVRLYQFPLSVFDVEENRHGVAAGREGDAYSRIRALEALEESGLPVKVTDNRTGESLVAQVDSVEFTNVTPPDGPECGFGGVALVTLRRL